MGVRRRHSVTVFTMGQSWEPWRVGSQEPALFSFLCPSPESLLLFLVPGNKHVSGLVRRDGQTEKNHLVGRNCGPTVFDSVRFTAHSLSDFSKQPDHWWLLLSIRINEVELQPTLNEKGVLITPTKAACTVRYFSQNELSLSLTFCNLCNYKSPEKQAQWASHQILCNSLFVTFSTAFYASSPTVSICTFLATKHSFTGYFVFRQE